MISKFLLLSICLSITFFVTTAQINKDGIFLGGNISFLSVKTNIYVPQNNPQLQRTISILPIIGKAVKDNLIVGINLNLGLSDSDNIGNSKKHKRNQYGGGFFLRKYKFIGAGFSIFAQSDLFSFYEETIYFRNIQTEKLNGPSIGLSFYPGISYSFSKKLQLETGFNDFFNLNYSQQKRLIKSIDNTILNNSTMNVFSVGTSLNNLISFNLGFRLLINR